MRGLRQLWSKARWALLILLLIAAAYISVEYFVITLTLMISLLIIAHFLKERKTQRRTDIGPPSEDCRAYKPRPEMFEKALSFLGLESREILHVGDSFRCDVQGAKALGMPVLWVNRTGKQVPNSKTVADFESTDLTILTSIVSDGLA